MGVYPITGMTPSDITQATAKPIINSKQICVAFYDRKMFQLSSLTSMEPLSVLDIEFIHYSETDVELGSSRRKSRGFTFNK